MFKNLLKENMELKGKNSQDSSERPQLQSFRESGFLALLVEVNESFFSFPIAFVNLKFTYKCEIAGVNLWNMFFSH